MSRLTERIILALLALFILIYVGYQIYNSLYGSIKTDVAFEYTVSRYIPVNGIAIRSETTIEGNYSGIGNYIFEDGTRVTVGEKVAEFSQNDQSNLKLRRARELEDEIKMLKEASDSSVNNFSTTENLNRGIKEQLAFLSKISNSSRYANSENVRENLTSLIDKKQIATGIALNFDPRLAFLHSEYESLDINSANDSVLKAVAPVSGYFCKTVDGYENWLNIKSTENFTLNDYITAIDGAATSQNAGQVGKIVTNQNWIFAASAPKSSLEFVVSGQDVTISFDAIAKRIPAKVVQVLQENSNERAVLLLSCNQVWGELLELRRSNAVIYFNQYTGLRINMPDIRFLDEKRGVYVLENNTVRFRELDPIYEEQSFVLSRLIPPDSDETQYVNLFDRIVKGKDLYDGKVIQ